MGGLGAVLIPLNECHKYTPEQVGNKACNLGRLLAAGHRVPAGYCIPTSTLRKALSGMPASGFPGHEGTAAAHRQLLLSRPVETDLAGELHELWGRLQAERIVELVVRSSGVHEDADGQSMAGQFHTELAVRSVDALLTAVKRCWASAWQPSLPGADSGSHDLAVIIQEAVQPSVAGVLFTHSPLGDSDCLVVEASFGHGQNIVSGSGKSNRYRLSHADGAVEESPSLDVEVLSKAQLQELYEVGLAVEELFGKPQDIEWAYAYGKLYLLQTRPITTGALPSTFVFDMDDLEQGRRFRLGPMQGFFDVWAAKKVWIRRHARLSGYDMSKGYILGWRGGQTPAGLVEKIGAGLRGEVLELIAQDHRQMLHRAELANAISLLSGAQGGEQVVLVRERLPSEVSGIATYVEDGRILVEYTRGAFIGLNSGELAPSTYVLDRHARVVEHHLVENPYYYDLGGAELGWVVVPTSGPPPDLTPADLSKISAMLRRMTDRFGEVRLEWYIHGDHVLFGDLAFEVNPIYVTPSDSGAVVSPGAIAGQVFKISDLTLFEDLLLRHDLSVHRQAGYFEALEDKALRPVLKRLAEQRRPIVAVAEYPHPGLSLIARMVDGFIFDRAPLLSHLAIILREQGVPARAVTGATKQMVDGQWLELTGT